MTSKKPTPTSVATPLLPSETASKRAGVNSTPDLESVGAALMGAIDAILGDLGISTRTKLIAHWSNDPTLEPALNAFLKTCADASRGVHKLALEFAGSAADYFENLAVGNGLGRKGYPYAMRLRLAMEMAATRRFIKYETNEHPDIEKRLFKFDESAADSVRLVGAADEWFDGCDVFLEFLSTERYSVPPEIQPSYPQRLERLKELNAERGVPFTNGDIARLRKMGIEIPDALTEKKKLVLQADRVSWYDYSVVRDYVTECRIRDKADELKTLIDVEGVCNRQMHRTLLPNNIAVCVTLVSSDEFLLYTRRDAVSGAAGLLSTSVTENIHFEKDKLERDAKGRYSIPLYQCAERGIKEELSPTLTSRVELTLLGLSFNLDFLECGLHFLGEAAATRQEIADLCAESPGDDYLEGHGRWVSLGDRSELTNLLAQRDWLSCGKASIIRALEYLRSRKSAHP